MAVRDLFRLGGRAVAEARGGSAAGHDAVLKKDTAGQVLPSVPGSRPRLLPLKRHGILLAVIAFTVSSCSGDGDTTGRPEPAVTSGTASSSAGSSPGPATSAPSALGLWPEDFVLTEGPATAGFTGVPIDADAAAEAVAAAQSVEQYSPEFADCVGLSAEDLDNEPEATALGATFVSDNDDGTVIISGAEIVTEKQAVFDTVMWSNPWFADCLGQETQARMDARNAAGDDELEYQLTGTLSPPAPTGATGYVRMTTQARGRGITYDIATDTLFFLVDHVKVTVNYTSYDPAPPIERLQLIADQIAGKLARQQPRSIAGRPTLGGTGLRAAGMADGSTVSAVAA
ncbi:hypothetical protein Ga0074812_1424 [Parafrankia irregularis]|uniref:Uncharacterized protein n=1 Tax=Parafrankia irregularis TaxID=795642 RepID=A0A0S4QZC1_9ACTN|nr:MULTISPECIES: hypothetical protein [Parafrankia]MBE3203591.1 hypothetical protein [Parafrankia sp. CH37]CUU60527.1 hypothetical protein Ga0074812_1424 [Parafrankia irregularis]